MSRTIFTALCAALAIGLLAVPPTPASAQAPRVEGRAGDWVQVFAAGLRIYRTTTEAGSAFSFGCDVAASADASKTGITMEIRGKLLPPNSLVAFTVNGQSVTMPSGPGGGVTVADCAGCAEKFDRLWRLAREGTSLTVRGSDGNTDTFSLSGTSALLPAEPCGDLSGAGLGPRRRAPGARPTRDIS